MYGIKLLLAVTVAYVALPSGHTDIQASKRINEASAISLEERLQQLETKLDAEIRHNDVLTKKLEELSENCVTKNDLNSLSKVPRQAFEGLAFSVYLDHDTDYGLDQTVKFNKIITNEGESYNNHTGVFTCPEGGLYLISYFVGERDERGVWAGLYVNSERIVGAAVDSFHASQDLQGGNVVVVRLHTGDVVWVEVRGGHVEGSPNLRLSTFSGVFISG